VQVLEFKPQYLRKNPNKFADQTLGNILTKFSEKCFQVICSNSHYPLSLTFGSQISKYVDGNSGKALSIYIKPNQGKYGTNVKKICVANMGHQGAVKIRN
jgi:hypothetical protein